MNAHGLSDSHLNIIRSILHPYADKLTQVGLFGSRATGTYRPHSDIDMVLYGAISEAEVAHLSTVFSDSLLPFTVDLHAYHLITYPPLKAHIDAVMLPLIQQPF